jgi:peptide/nickel transport system substrate-binding protein
VFYKDEIEVSQGIYLFPTGLDPVINRELFEYQIFSQIYEPLLSLDNDYKTILPCLAESWSISEDNLIYEFQLKSNVFFHNGNFLTAEDVKASFFRQMKIQHRSPILGIIESIDILDSLSFQIKLKHPYAPFLYTLASPSGVMIISKEALEKYGENIGKNPVGTGPFMLDQWKQDRFIKLRSFSKYREKSDIEVVKFILPDDTQQSENMFKNGELDIHYTVASHWLDRLKWLGMVRYVVQEPLSTVFIGFNMNNIPVKNRSIREAILYALNTERTVYITNRGNAISAKGPLPPIYSGFDDLVQTKYNPEMSRSLLKREGYKNGLSLNLYAFEPTFSRQTRIEIIKSQLSKVGITINKKLFYKWEGFTTAIDSNECHLFLEGYSSEFIGDPGNFLYTLFHSSSPYNRFNFSDKKVDQLLENAFQEESQEKRHEMYRLIVTQVLEAIPAVFESHIKSHFAYNSKKIKSLLVNPYEFIYFHRLETYE